MDEKTKIKLKAMGNLTRFFTELYNNGNFKKKDLVASITALAQIYDEPKFLEILKHPLEKHKEEFNEYKKAFNNCEIDFID